MLPPDNQAAGLKQHLTNNRLAYAIVIVTLVMIFAIMWYTPKPTMTQNFDLTESYNSLTALMETSTESTSIATSTSTQAAIDGIPNDPTKGINGSCAILYLAHQPRAPQLINSMNFLFKNFNTKYRYPVIVFYDDKYGKEFFDIPDLLKKLTIPEEDKKLIHFEYIKFVFPEGFSEANKSQVTVWPHAFPPYNHMIAFWGYYVFHHPLVKCLDYYLRLDTDTNIFDPVKVDLFEMMRQKNYHYGYRSQASDPDWVTVGLGPFSANYVTQNKIKVAQPNRLKDVLNAGPGSWIPIYYNNFEIVHVPTFLRSDMEAFRLAFLMTYRIYTHRWGDAPQRYVMVNMFLNESEVHVVCESSYEHQGIRTAATC